MRAPTPARRRELDLWRATQRDRTASTGAFAPPPVFYETKLVAVKQLGSLLDILDASKEARRIASHNLNLAWQRKPLIALLEAPVLLLSHREGHVPPGLKCAGGCGIFQAIRPSYSSQSLFLGFSAITYAAAAEAYKEWVVATAKEVETYRLG